MNLKCVIPQDLSITASPEFVGLTLSGLTDRHVLFSDSGVLTGDADLTFVESQTVATATNATPIVMGIVGHGRQNGDQVCVSGAVGNTAANGTWSVANQAADTFELEGSVGNGVYTPDSATADANIEVSGCASFHHLRIEEDGGFSTHIGTDSTNSLYIQTLNGTTSGTNLLSSLGAGERTLFKIFGAHGGPDDIFDAGGTGNYHVLSFGYHTDSYRIWSGFGGGAVSQPIEIFTTNHRKQIHLLTGGGVDMDTGTVSVNAGHLYLGDSSKTFTIAPGVSAVTYSYTGLTMFGSGVRNYDFVHEGTGNFYFNRAQNPNVDFYIGSAAVANTFRLLGATGAIYMAGTLQVVGATLFNSGNRRKIQTVTGTGSAVDLLLTGIEYTILLDGSAFACTVNLDAVPLEGQIYNFKCVDATNACTVGRNGKTIDRVASDFVLSLDECVSMQADSGGNWEIVV